MKPIYTLIAGITALGVLANPFETQSDIKDVKGNISLDENIYCYGKSSLRWEAAPGAKLQLPLTSPRQEFSFHIYSAKPIPSGTISMKAGSAKQKRYFSGSFPINFNMWRLIRVAPWEDWKATKDPKAQDVLELTWNGKTPAVFHLDAYHLSAPWTRTPNEQLPLINPKRPAFHSYVKPPVIMQKIRSEVQKWRTAPAPTEQEKESLELVRSRMKEWLSSYDKGHPVLTKAYQKKLLDQAKTSWKEYKKFQFRREGKKLHYTYDPEPVAGNDVAQRPLVHKVIAPLARLYNIPFEGNPYYKKPEVRQALLDMVEMMLYQGFAYGADHNWGAIFHIREMGQLTFLMQEDLKEAGLLPRLQWAILWYGRLLAFAQMTQSEAEPGADLLRCAISESFVAALTLPDNSANAALHAVRKVLSDQLVITGGTTDLIKPDGTLFHHGQVANSAYGPDGLYSALVMANLLNGTVYAPDQSIYQNVRKAIINLDRQQNYLDTPAATNVRWAFCYKTAVPLAPIAAYWLAIHPEDKEVGAIFRRVYQAPEQLCRGLITCCPFDSAPGEFIAMDNADKLTAEIPAAKAQEGNFLYPYSAFQIHRRDNWMIATRGFGKHAWAYETGSFNPNGYENKLARFVSHGPLQIFAEGKNAQDSGFVDSGWDPIHFPGTTAPALQLEELVLPRDPYKYGRNYTPARLAGGGNIQGTDGTFGLELIDPAIKGFRALKSYHFCGDTIVALGSGITSPQADKEVHTTLYQNYLGKAENAASPSSETVKEETVLTDKNGTRYYIPAQSPLVVRRGVQTAPDYYGKGSYSGEYEIAWINHGKAPKNGKYHYALRMNPADDAAPVYTVLAQTEGIHAVHFPSARLYSAAVLDTAEELPEAFPLRKVSRPGIYLAREMEDGTLLISFTDTDFMPKEKEAHPPIKDILSLDRTVYPEKMVIKAELRDRWSTASGKTRLQGNILAVQVDPGFSTEVILSK